MAELAKRDIKSEGSADKVMAELKGGVLVRQGPKPEGEEKARKIAAG